MTLVPACDAQRRPTTSAARRGPKRVESMQAIASTTNAASRMADSQHSAMVHDAQLDFYGKRLATCSSDRSIKVYDLDAGGQRTMSADLRIHNGPVWSVAWAHPRFGCAPRPRAPRPIDGAHTAPQPSSPPARTTAASLCGARRRRASGALWCVRRRVLGVEPPTLTPSAVREPRATPLCSVEADCFGHFTGSSTQTTRRR